MKKIDLNTIDVIIFDFDGVMTNNMVYLSEDGKESVRCCRSDGLAIDVLRNLGKPMFIISGEKNQIVSTRAKKLSLPVIQSAKDKVSEVRALIKENSFSIDKTLFVGNDLNDLEVMKFCGHSACPSDSHQEVKNIADILLKKKGGDGLIMELLSDIFQINYDKISEIIRRSE